LLNVKLDGDEKMSVIKLIQEKFGGRVVPRTSIKTIETGKSVEVVKDNPNRVGLLIQNIGSYSIYMNIENPATVGGGLLLLSNGGTYSINWEEDGILPCKSHHAIASGGNSTVIVIELILIR